MLRLRLDPQDEYLHPLEEAVNFNESMYFNFCDAGQGLGGFLRLGNRPNEGHAELTTCLYLPREAAGTGPSLEGGRVAFFFQRPEISDNDAFDAGGMRFTVHEPFRRLHVSYEGKVVVLEEPLQMADPRRAFKENPSADASVSLTYTGLSPMYGGEPVDDDDGAPLEPDPGQAFARGHYEQHVAAAGTVTVGDERWEVSGFGLRDHSWGPRYWQAPWYYRWLTMNFGANFGMVLSHVATRSGGAVKTGVVFTEGRYDPISALDVETEWQGADRYHRTIRATVATASDTYEVQGEVLNLIPLRNRRRSPDGDELETRISEGMTEWRCADRVGYGLSEYLDQIVDGRPVGAD